MAPEYITAEAWLPHRVSYGETDTMGYLYYGEYLHLFERARSHFIREAGMSYAAVEERGIMLPVREANCRYRVPSRYDDLIYVRVGVTEWRKASMTFAYEVYDETKEQLRATGFTQHACADLNGRPVAVPEWLRSLWTSAPEIATL